MKATDYQQRIHQLEVALRKSKEREASLQTRLQEAVSEVECTNAQVADLQIVVDKGRQEVSETKLQYEVNRKVLISANHTIREDLKAVCNWLNIVTHDFTVARKWRCVVAYMGVLCAVYGPACGTS